MQVKTVFLPTDKPLTLEACAPLIATLRLEVTSHLIWFQVFNLVFHMEASQQ